MDVTEDYRRYAVYFAPPAGSGLARVAAAWLGIDPETGESVPVDSAIAEYALIGLPVPREQLVRSARVYGFHATLKAPFRLDEDTDFATLDEAVAALAAERAPVTAPALVLSSEIGFVALTPRRPSPALNALAGACVTQLDGLRAPLNATEIAKRRRGGLDTIEEQHLRNWGYPYVLDRFRFHMTLTIQLSRGEAARVVDKLEAVFGPYLDEALVVDEICIFGDPGDGKPFRLLRRHALTGSRED
jgi:putative phosphonate metabolism protein